MTTIKLPHNHGQNFEKANFIPEIKNFQVMADLFKLISDSNRIYIFWILCYCEECVINISALVKMSSPAVSHHLKQLKYSGLITSHREGKEVYYKVADTEEAKLLHQTIKNLLTLNNFTFSKPFEVIK